MKQLVATILVACMLGSFAIPSEAAAAAGNACSPDMTSIAPLEVLAKQKGSVGVTAKSALRYLARENLSTAGYFMSKSSSSGGKGKVAYHLYHESGFKKPCVVGNQSGKDGVLVVDATTHEVERFLFEQ
jgi:hypothetical protein